MTRPDDLRRQALANLQEFEVLMIDGHFDYGNGYHGRVVAGPVMGGALLAHTIAGLLDARHPLTHPPTSFAPLSVDPSGAMVLRRFYRSIVADRRVLLADDIRNTGETFEKAKGLIEGAGGTVIASVEIYDRLEAIVDLGVPNFALAEYRAPENYRAADCPMCKAGMPVTSF